MRPRCQHGENEQKPGDLHRIAPGGKVAEGRLYPRGRGRVLPILFVEKFSIDPFRELAYLPATLERRGGQTGGLAAETTGAIEQNGRRLIPHQERDGTFCGTLVAGVGTEAGEAASQAGGPCTAHSAGKRWQTVQSLPEHREFLAPLGFDVSGAFFMRRREWLSSAATIRRSPNNLAN
jgi:hypothetical protein